MSSARRTVVSTADHRQSATALLAADRLAVLQSAYVQLSRSESLEEIKGFRDTAEAVRQLARSARAGLEVQNLAAELKLRSERRAGEILRSMSLRGGDRKTDARYSRTTLEQLGIDQNQSTRWQKLAAVPDEEFQRVVTAAQKGKIELTSASLLRLAASRRRTRQCCPGGSPEDSRCASHVVENATSPINDIIAELLNHWDVIHNILGLVCDDGATAGLRPEQVRHLRRLLSECKSGLLQLRSLNAGSPVCSVGGCRQPEGGV